VWQSYEGGLGYIDKFRTMRVHVLRIELAQFASHLPLFNHEVVYKTIKGYFHDLKQQCFSPDEYAVAGPLFLYSVERASGIWTFLGELRPLLLLGATLAEGKMMGQHLENLDTKLSILRRHFGEAAVLSDAFQAFMDANTPRQLQDTVEQLIAQGMLKLTISTQPFDGDMSAAERSMRDLNLFFTGDISMNGDSYEIGQAGAVGRHAEAHDMTFNQIWTKSASNIDLHQLGSELTELRSALIKQASEPDQFVALGEVAAAEKAAKGGDGPAALEHLKRAGTWVWDVATKVGIGVATAAAKNALGF
jgi:hypothetical protein